MGCGASKEERNGRPLPKRGQVKAHIVRTLIGSSPLKADEDDGGDSHNASACVGAGDKIAVEKLPRSGYSSYSSWK
ncbi:hypothetical protein KSP39_PZI013796 [Platanthera zijinensis]|uniref:Uncharacterized protein n=1 Tax=Platanthera zijinensis TaxID=2320716 RepID=A0AAP0BGA2_9ASPA